MSTRPIVVVLTALVAVVGLAYLLQHEASEPQHDLGDEARFATGPSSAAADHSPTVAQPDAAAAERRTAPPTADPRARVRLEVFDHRGAPVTDGYSVAVREAIDWGMPIYTGPAPGPIASADVREGVADFEVPFDTELELSVSHRDGLVHPAHAALAALVAGETRSVRVRLLPPLGFLVGFLVDADRKPVADADVTVAVPFGPTEHASTRTDATGRFRVGFLPHPGRPRMVEVAVGIGGVRAAWSNGEREELAATPRARATLRLPFGSEVHDLGTLVLEPVPTFANGLVVDEAGRPIVGVEVATSILGVFDSGFREVPSLRARTDADGRFSIREWAPSTPMRVRIEVDDPVWSTTAVETDLRTANDLRLVARPCAAASGSVRLSPVVIRAEVQLVVRDQPHVEVVHRWRDRYTARQLEWTAKGIAPGPFELELRSGDAVLWRSGRLVAALGVCLRDEGLQSVDLTDR